MSQTRGHNLRENFVCVCDSKTDGSFLIHHFLSFYIKAGCKVCFVALVQSFSHYSIIAQKLGTNLGAAKERGQLVFLEGLKSSVDILFSEEPRSAQPHPFQFISNTGEDLKSLYHCIQTSLSQTDSSTWKFPVLIVDDLSVLLSLGVNVVNVLDFIHYCRATICSKLKGTVVTLAHSDEDIGDEEMELIAKLLSHQSSLMLKLEGLATGYCKDVHGEIKITWRGASHIKPQKNITEVYQYKIQDKNVRFFARGTSSAVL
nr:PREDICTED: elongator complex protein 6 isoform X2 [Latimeria chalumnae]|eukprot:XP_014353136.1 PREDICTED: elongator complex protein 6 isoform X2 [Latimeria chalumnae]